MSKGHRTQIKRLRNSTRETRPYAKLKYVRLSDSKARIVLNQIKGKSVPVACAILRYSPRYAAYVILKLLKSAMANAENNKGLDPKKLFVENVFADRATIMRRIRPRAKGRAYGIKKRFCHITLILNENIGG